MMRLASEFTVPATLEDAWVTLLDVQRVARCVPGASLQSSRGDGTYHGSINLPLDRASVEYDGSVAIFEVDEDTRVATFEARARQTHGHGIARAFIVNRLESAGEGTRVVVESDLHVGGCGPESGPASVRDVAERLLAEFATRLEHEVMSGASPVAHQRAAAGMGDSSDGSGRQEGWHDLLPAVVARALARVLPIVATALVGVVAIMVYRRRWSTSGAKVRS